MPRLLAWSLAVHLLVLLVSFLFPSSEQEDIPRIREVKLVLRQRVVSKDIVPDPVKESAPGQDKQKSDQMFDESFFRRARQQLTGRSRANADEPIDRTSRDRGRDPSYDRLLKAPDSKHGRLDRSSSPNVDDLPGRRDMNKDRSTRDGDYYSIGRSDLNRNADNRDPDRDSGSRRANQGNTGSGVTGTVNVRGRRVVYRPVMTLPAKYNKRGLSHSVSIRVVVSPEGIITAASVVGPTGDAELDRILVQFARRHRLEAISGTDQSGTISFYIRPR